MPKRIPYSRKGAVKDTYDLQPDGIKKAGIPNRGLPAALPRRQVCRAHLGNQGLARPHRRPHNPKVASSNLAPATTQMLDLEQKGNQLGSLFCLGAGTNVDTNGQDLALK